MPLLTVSGAEMKINGKNNDKSVTEGGEKGASSLTISASINVGGLSGSGIAPVSPALAGEFFTTEPPGKP